jgi:Tol biopolymer transport system component
VISEVSPQANGGLWQVNHDGTGLLELVDQVGLVQQPDISVHGDIAFVDDTRWDKLKDELAIYTISGKFVHASGPSVDTLFNGFRPSWSPDGSRIALGANYVTVNGEGKRRVSIFHVGPEGTDIYRETDSPPEFPYLRENEEILSEGGNSVAWDPRDEYIAYNMMVYDTLSMDPVTLNYDQRYLLALWRIGTSEVRVLAEDAIQNFGWSPNGDYLLFNRYDSGIWQVPREGGEPVNLSDLTLEGAEDFLGGFCK